jgi:hypothetical protein
MMICRPLRKSGPNHASAGLSPSPQAMAYCLSGFRPAGKILSILLILSKNPGELTRCVEGACSNCLPTQNSEEPFFMVSTPKP